MRQGKNGAMNSFRNNDEQCQKVQGQVQSGEPPRIVWLKQGTKKVNNLVD